MIKLYFPESFGQVDHVGYNHAVSLFNKILGAYITKDPTEADFRVHCNLPWHHNPKDLKKDGLPLIHYTMYESTKVPKSWVKYLNKNVDIVLVPSLWCKKVFIKSGVKKPIHVLSLCYDSDKIKYVKKQNNLGSYVFLWQGVVFDSGGRKGLDVVKKAFLELKRDCMIGSDAKLVLKVKPWKDKPVEIDGIENGQGVVYLQRNLSREQLENLYKKVDCCINPTHGEGFGLIPLEQMAMGKPVIVTDWSMPYLEHDHCYKLKYELKKSPVYFNHKFIAVSLNGMAYNFGGLYNDVVIMPKIRKLMADNKNVVGVYSEGVKPPKLSFLKTLKAKINNWFYYFQKATHFYFDTTRKKHLICGEHPGYDAFVDVEDLKEKMIYCYNNKTIAEDKGFMASHYVERNWGKDRMLRDFENLIPILKQFTEERNG